MHVKSPGSYALPSRGLKFWEHYYHPVRTAVVLWCLQYEIKNPSPHICFKMHRLYFPMYFPTGKRMHNGFFFQGYSLPSCPEMLTTFIWLFNNLDKMIPLQLPSNVMMIQSLLFLLWLKKCLSKSFKVRYL